MLLPKLAIALLAFSTALGEVLNEDGTHYTTPYEQFFGNHSLSDPIFHDETMFRVNAPSDMSLEEKIISEIE